MIGHQEFVNQWGGLIDIDDADDRVETAARICEHILTNGSEDQIAIRGRTTFVPRLRPSSKPDQSFPHQTHARCDLRRDRGSGSPRPHRRHLSCRTRGTPYRTVVPKRDPTEKPLGGTTCTMTGITQPSTRSERSSSLGAQVTTASVDITDVDQVERWLSNHHPRWRSTGPWNRPRRRVCRRPTSGEHDRSRFHQGTGSQNRRYSRAAQHFPRARSGILCHVRVRRVGHRLARSRQLCRRERISRRLRALPTGPGAAGSHYRLGPMVGRNGRRAQAGKDLRCSEESSSSRPQRAP